MTRRRWGQRKLSDATIREIRVLLKTLPRCEQTDRQVGARFHVGHAIIRNIALGWMTPQGGDRLPDPLFPRDTV